MKGERFPNGTLFAVSKSSPFLMVHVISCVHVVPLRGNVATRTSSSKNLQEKQNDVLELERPE